MDTQKYTVLVGNSLVYKMEIKNRSNETQVERFQPKSPVYDRYIKEVAGNENFAKQQSHIADKKLNERQVFVEALQTTSTAAHSIYNEADNGTHEESTKLFKQLATTPQAGIQFNEHSGKLSYKNLEITASNVDGKLEANIFMRGCKDFNELIASVKDFYQVAKIAKDGQSGEYVAGEVHFPNADGKYEDFNHFYVTADNTVVIDKHSFDIIVKAYEQAKMMMPEYVANKRKYYASAEQLQSAPEQRLSFTYDELRKINEDLRKPRAEDQAHEVAVLKQQMAQTVDQLKQQHLKDLTRLQQENAQLQQVNIQKDKEIDDLTQEVEILSNALRRDKK